MSRFVKKLAADLDEKRKYSVFNAGTGPAKPLFIGSTPIRASNIFLLQAVGDEPRRLANNALRPSSFCAANHHSAFFFTGTRIFYRY